MNPKSPYHILIEALDTFKPKKIVLMFSGGHDSLVSTYLCAEMFEMWNIDFEIYHGDITIGIPETQDYVKSVCKEFGWKLNIRTPPNSERGYEWIIEKFGFPGPNRASHQICYRWLKSRALDAFVTHECKTKPHARENVLLCTGVRREESKIRMGYVNEINKENSKIWANPIFHFTEKDCSEFIELKGLPKNPVKEKICISGECLCGCFAKKEEFAEIKKAYPETAKRIEELHEMAKKNGHPWPWGVGPTNWYKKHPKNQANMFMCVGCENIHEYEKPPNHAIPLHAYDNKDI